MHTLPANKYYEDPPPQPHSLLWIITY